MLVCGKPQLQPGRTDTIINPLVVIEVLSKSIENYDRGQKFDFYRSIPTLQHYLLIEQERVHIEYYHKLADGRWVLTVLKDLEATLTLASLELEIPLRLIYAKVDWVATRTLQPTA